MPSVSQFFDIPKFFYFDSGNDYSGSNGNFSYKITTADVLTCKTWHGRLCSMKAQIEHEQQFERSEEGFAEMIKWLEEMFKE
ncbi:MAG: hypothetical protein IJ779_08680 [Ruminococcus sp.]|nr:hypothetical protein [Ruminococcus sp.]